MTARVVDLDAGRVMVVTDLHGDWPLYARYRDHFLELRARGLADTLVITGDFIHRESPPEEDRSLEIVRDLRALQAELGDALRVLLGNHELPHLYHIPLMKGDHVYTPRFEAALGAERAEILAFFDALPFFVRTRAGVALCHAGAFPAAHMPAALERLWHFSHQQVLDNVKEQLAGADLAALRAGVGKLFGASYAALARQHQAVTGPDDPRYDDFLVGALVDTQPEFELLWSVFFTLNEREHGMRTYTADVAALLARLSEGYAPQRVLVAGHLGCRNGYRVLAEGQQLRLASGAHAHPYESGRYLLFDAGVPITKAADLRGGLQSVFETGL